MVEEENYEWHCSKCGWIVGTAPSGVGVATFCKQCGTKLILGGGVAIETSESHEIYEEMKKRRKRDLLSRRESEG